MGLGLTDAAFLTTPTDPLWNRAGAYPSLDLPFSTNKNLIDSVTGQNLITFTRASAGTYVDSTGVLRTATTNLLLRSEEFDDAAWSKTGLQAFGSGSVANTTATAAPDGTFSADKIVEDTSTGLHRVFQSPTFVSGLPYTASFYAKAAERTRVVVEFRVLGAVGSFLVNLSTGVVSGSATGQTATAVAVGNGWYRIAVTASSSSSTGLGNVIIYIDNGTASTYTGDGTSGIYIWGAQLEQSSTVGEYIPTTSTINSAPRFDHNPSTLESLGLLVEEQRTNSIRNNTMVGAVAGTPGTVPTYWSTFITGSTGISREVVGTGVESGINYVDLRFFGTSTGGGVFAVQADTNTGVAALNGQTWTFSTYVRVVAGSVANLVSSQIIVAEYSSGGSFLVESISSITMPTSAYSRPTLTRANTNASTAFESANLRFGYNTGVAIDITLRIGLPQLEQGAFATSPILTSGTAATRSADVAIITGTNFSSWYRQDEGTVFVSAATSDPSGLFPCAGSINDGTPSNRIQVGRTNASGAAMRVFVLDAGAASVNGMTVGTTSANTLASIAFGYQLNNFGGAANGLAATPDASGTVPTVNQFQVGNGSGGGALNGTIRRLTYWPQRLSNATLQSITQ